MTTARCRTLTLCLGLLGSAAQAVAQPEAVATPVAAQAAPPPVEAFFDRPAMSQPRLSPSGRWLAVLVRGAVGRNVLGVYDLHGDAPPRPLARFDHVDIGQVHWLGDERLVFDITDHEAGGGELRRGPGLFVVRVDGSGLRQLVSVAGLGRLVSGRDSYSVLAPNHWLLQVPAAGGLELLMGELQASQGRLDDVQPFWLNVETGDRRWVRSLPRGGVQKWWFDPAGEPRLASRHSDGRVTLQWRAPGQDGWVPLLDADALALPWTPLQVDATGQLWVTQPSGPGGTAELTTFDFAAGRPRPQVRVSTPGFDFAGELLNDAPGTRTLGVRVQAEAETTVWFDAAYQALQDEVDRRLPGRVNRLDCRHCGSAQQVALVESRSDSDPGSYFVWRGLPGTPRLLGRRLPRLDSAAVAELAFQRVPARDGLDLPLWFTRPAGAQPGARLPAVLLVHGGPWLRGGHWGWDPLPQFLASRGYVVIEPEYRGSTGFGDAHFRAGWRQWGQAMQDDLDDAMRWAVAQKWVDPQRVCIAGGSYGGYAALMGAARSPALYRCAAAWSAITDPFRYLEGDWLWGDDISAEARAHGLPRLVGDARADEALLTAASPLAQAARILAPVLLVHGEKDRRVPLVHARDMRAALTRAGRPPEWLTYADEAHGWRKTENQRDFARRLEAFLGRHLAVPMAADGRSPAAAPAASTPR